MKGHCSCRHKRDIGLFQEDVDGSADSALSHSGIEVLAPALDAGVLVFPLMPFTSPQFSSNPCFGASSPI